MEKLFFSPWWLCLPSSQRWEASAKVISSGLCPWLFVFIPSLFSLPGQGSVSNSHLQHCSWCCSLLLLPMILFITLWVTSSPLGPAKTLKSAAARCWEMDPGGFPALSRSPLHPNSPPSLFSSYKMFLWHLAGAGQAVLSSLLGLWALSVPQQPLVLVSLSPFDVLYWFVTLNDGIWVWVQGFWVLQ